MTLTFRPSNGPFESYLLSNTGIRGGYCPISELKQSNRRKPVGFAAFFVVRQNERSPSKVALRFGNNTTTKIHFNIEGNKMSNRRCFLMTALVWAAMVMFTQTAMAQSATEKEVVVIETNHGELVLELWPEKAPKTVENFKKLIGKDFYDGTAFHRIIDGFMIQGGDPLTKDEGNAASWGTGGPGYTIDAEFNDSNHVRGVLSMARVDDPDSAGSQFFICLATQKHLDGKYTAFGKLVAGDDVLKKLGDVECGGAQRSTPKERVELKSMKIEKREFEVKE